MKTTMNRRSFVRTAGAAAVASMMAGTSVALAADAPAADGTLVPGIYEATAPGYMGANTVHVTVDETSIVKVDVVASTDEPAWLSKFAISTIPGRIVEAQSTAVDVVSGATFTSFSIISAVEDCLAQAGAAGAFSKAPASVEKAEGETEETDILVVGAGASGVMAALASVYADFDGMPSGLKVTLIDKQDFIGGSAPLAIGAWTCVGPVDRPLEEGYVENETERFRVYSPDLEVNEPYIAHILNESGPTVCKMQRMGVGIDTHLVDNPDAAFPPPAVDSWDNYWVACPFDFMKPMVYLFDPVIDALSVLMANNGVDVRTSTAATELLMEDGAVVGAKVEGPDSIYQIRAKKVILTTGGFAQNQQMVEEYAPHDAASMIWSNGGCDGDGIRMGIEAGGHVKGDRCFGYIGSGKYGIHNGSLGGLTGKPDNCVRVNANGETFSGGFFGFNGNEWDILNEQPGATCWVVMDSTSPHLAVAQTSPHIAEFLTEAQSLEELAELTGISADGLVATVEAHNAALAAGEVEEAAETPEVKNIEDYVTEGAVGEEVVDNPIATPPFYAIQYNSVRLGTLVGLAVDADGAVVDESGAPIPNLFAAGELVMGGNLFQFYVGGWSLGSCLPGGCIAAETAKAQIMA